MDSTKHVALKSVETDFIEDLLPKYIMHDLRKDNIVTEKEKNNILSLLSPEQQAQKLFDILLQKSSEVLNNFFEVLKKEDDMGVYYPWLAEKIILSDLSLRGKIPNKKIQDLLVKGGVPYQTNHLLNREEKIRIIREKLHFATKQDGKRHWVVLHGMSGTGKSVLAAEAVRNGNFIENNFPGGVFLISLGELRDENAVGLKIKKLFRLMNAEEKLIFSTEYYDLTQELKNIVKSKKILLILDDLWVHKKSDVIALFDIGCPILVTTNFHQAFDRYSEFCSFIRCTNNFTIEESKQLLALYVRCETDMLPPFVESICIKCKGSPFIVSHIGRWMAPYGNDENFWKDLKLQIDHEKRPHSALRRRHTSAEDLAEIKKIIRSTLNLNQIEKSKDYVFDLLIFPDDIKVCSKVLEVFWGVPSYKVSCIIHPLTSCSLVDYENDSLNNFKYGIHDLYLELLLEICTDIKERHLRFVNSYLHLCKLSSGKYDFSLLPVDDDDYIFHYIGYHMVQVENLNIIDGVTLDQIYFDLKFIQTKLIRNHSDLLCFYQNYKSKFKDQEQLKCFEHFARKVASKKLSEHCDIIQWGLFEPKDSIIYNKALEFAMKSEDKSYFLWCNQEENQSHMPNLSSWLIKYENMNCAAISSDGQLIACAGSDNKVKIFSTETSKELLVLAGHESKINYCVFHSQQPVLASASDDESVRIFGINIPQNVVDVRPIKECSSNPGINISSSYIPGMSNGTYMQHGGKVLCCNFSPQEDLVVSSDSRGYAHVWNFKTCDTKYTVYHSVEINDCYPEIYNCYFNPDGQIFVTTAYDSLKLWNTKDRSPIKTISCDKMCLNRLCFSNNHVITVSDNKIHKCSIESDTRDRIPLNKNLKITACSLSPDGNFLACGTSECTILVYNINTGKLISNLKGHRNSVCSVMYAENNQKLLSVSEDGYIVHNIAEIKDVSIIGFEGSLSVQHNSNDLTIACSNSQNSIEIRKGISAQLYCKTDRDDFDITACSLSNNCAEVVYGTKNGSVKVFNIQDKFLDKTLPNHNKQVNYITHSKNDLFFTCSEDKTIMVWKNKIPMILKGHTQAVVMCVPFKKSNRLLSCSKDAILIVWDIEDGEKLIISSGHGNQDIRFCDISYDEKYMATASADCTVKIWDCDNGDLYRELECGDAVRFCRFSSKYQALVSGTDSGDVKYWQLGPRTTHTSYKQSSCVYNAFFNRDSLKYLTVSDDIKIFKTGQAQPQTLQLPSFDMSVTRPNVWVSDDFDIFVVIHESVLYVLKRIVASNGNSCH